MKLIINGYEVEIKARKLYDKRASKKATQYFLNDISILAGEARARYEERGLEVLSRFAKTYSDNIFDELDRQGIYGE